jgi:hypothetical protein
LRVDRDLARRKGAGALGAQASGGAGRPAKQHNSLAVIFSRRYLGRTVTMSALLGLWAGAVYEPTASAAVGLLTSRPLETDLTRVEHCTQR